MPYFTAQQLETYYQGFPSEEVTFTKNFMDFSGYLKDKVFLKCLGEQWPCIIYSSSMNGAKIVMNINNVITDLFNKANNIVSIRYAFTDFDKKEPVHFFITARIIGFTPYRNQKESLNFISLTFTQKPPDFLIYYLGKVLELNQNSEKRCNDRVIITPENYRALGLEGQSGKIYIMGLPRKCIFRDISFSGMKIIVAGFGKLLIDKSVEIECYLDNVNRIYRLKGKIIRFETVSDRKDLCAIGIEFEKETVPLELKSRILEILSNPRMAF